MLRRTLLSNIAGAAATVGVGCSTKQQASGPMKLRVLAGRSIAMSSLFQAHERGYFKDAGFEIEIDQTVTPSSNLALLAGKKADVAFASLGVPFLSAMAKGLPVRFAAGREVARPNCGNFGGFFALRKRFPNGLDNAAVLKGKTVGVGSMIGFPQFSLDAHLATAGLSADDIIPRTMRSNEAIAAVIGGSLDAAVINWDFDRNLERILPDIVRTPPLAHYHPNLQISYIFFGPMLLEADPAIGGRFLAAYLKGAREFVGGATPDFMKRFAAEFAGDESRVLGVCRDTVTTDGAIDLGSIQTVSAWAFKRKYLAEPFESAKYVDTRFIERAHAT